MADIELVIKIPDIFYTQTKSYVEKNKVEGNILSALAHGTPLPKGHGRLIDADALKKDDEVTEWLSINPIRTGKMLNQFSKLFVKKIDDEPTIIEADKAGE